MLSDKKKYFHKDVLGWLLLGISVLMLGKSIALCFCNDIWYDELFTVGMIEHSYGELVAFTARDVHPPLYYCITKFVVDLCKLTDPAISTVIAAKLVSVLPYFILFFYSVIFLRKRFSTFTAGVFLFCAIAMPQLAGYTVEIRMYSWALLFVTAALLHAYGTLTAETAKIQRIHGTALVLYGLAAAYTQYFACVAVVMIYLYVLLVFLNRDKSRVREWLLWVAVSVLGYVPWLFSLIRQMTAVKENYWILPLTWRSLGGCIKFLMKPSFANDRLNTFLAVLLFVTYVGVFAHYAAKTIKLYHNRRAFGKSKDNRTDADAEQESEVDVTQKSGTVEETQAKITDRKMPEMENSGKDPAERLGFAAAGIGALGGLVLFGFGASMLLRPIFVYRYMIPAMGCFWLAFAVCLDGLPDSVSKRKAGGTLVITLLIAVIGLRNYRAFLGEEEYKALLMQDTQKALALIETDDIVICNFDQVQAVTSYYMEDTVDSYLWCDIPETLIQDIIRPYDTVDDTETVVALAGSGAAENKNVWFIGSFNSREEIAEEWRKAGLVVEEQGSCLLERYWFNLYKVSIAQ